MNIFPGIIRYMIRSKNIPPCLNSRYQKISHSMVWNISIGQNSLASESPILDVSSLRISNIGYQYKAKISTLVFLFQCVPNNYYGLEDITKDHWHRVHRYCIILGQIIDSKYQKILIWYYPLILMLIAITMILVLISFFN